MFFGDPSQFSLIGPAIPGSSLDSMRPCGFASEPYQLLTPPVKANSLGSPFGTATALCLMGVPEGRNKVAQCGSTGVKLPKRPKPRRGDTTKSSRMNTCKKRGEGEGNMSPSDPAASLYRAGPTFVRSCSGGLQAGVFGFSGALLLALCAKSGIRVRGKSVRDDTLVAQCGSTGNHCGK